MLSFVVLWISSSLSRTGIGMAGTRAICMKTSVPSRWPSARTASPSSRMSSFFYVPLASAKRRRTSKWSPTPSRGRLGSFVQQVMVGVIIPACRGQSSVPRALRSSLKFWSPTRVRIIGGTPVSTWLIRGSLWTNTRAKWTHWSTKKTPAYMFMGYAKTPICLAISRWTPKDRSSQTPTPSRLSMTKKLRPWPSLQRRLTTLRPASPKTSSLRSVFYLIIRIMR